MIIVVLIFAFLNWLLLYLLLPRLRLRILYYPTARSSHLKPTPSGGGISFVVITIISSFLCLIMDKSSLVVLPLLILPLALVGFHDDCYKLPAIWRYAIQFSTALIILWTCPLFHSFDVAVVWTICVATVLLLFITSLINFTNS